MGDIRAQAETLLVRMALVSYGATMNYQTYTSHVAARDNPPCGEAIPMHDRWHMAFEKAHDDDHLRDLVAAGQRELDGWLRRPFASDATESLEDLCARIVGDGWGISADECARAMRCTSTLVRRARLGAGRHPESGYHLPGPSKDRMLWALQLDAAGLTLRQIETVTGVPKSTLHDRLSRPRRTAITGG